MGECECAYFPHLSDRHGHSHNICFSTSEKTKEHRATLVASTHLIALCCRIFVYTDRRIFGSSVRALSSLNAHTITWPKCIAVEVIKAIKMLKKTIASYFILRKKNIQIKFLKSDSMLAYNAPIHLPELLYFTIPFFVRVFLWIFPYSCSWLGLIFNSLSCRWMRRKAIKTTTSISNKIVNSDA